MNTELSEEAFEVGDVFTEALDAAGGVDMMRQSILGADQREAGNTLVREMGLWDLDITEDRLQYEIAAQLARVAGSRALPFPIVERFARTDTSDFTSLVATQGARRVNHIDLIGEHRWDAVDLTGQQYEISAVGSRITSGMTPFVSEVSVEETGHRDVQLAANSTILQAWWLLGVLERALADTLQYTNERVQFGRPIVKFQAIAFQNAEMIAEVEGFREYAKYALWFASTQGGEAALTEALALRVTGLKASDLVFRLAHRHYGAMGFTDEVDLAWLNRAAQSVRRLPEDLHRSQGLLLAQSEKQGWNVFGA